MTSHKEFFNAMQAKVAKDEATRIGILKTIDKIEKAITNAKQGNTNSDLEIWCLELSQAKQLLDCIENILKGGIK